MDNLLRRFGDGGIPGIDLVEIGRPYAGHITQPLIWVLE
jgi:hypothetical protein